MTIAAEIRTLSSAARARAKEATCGLTVERLKEVLHYSRKTGVFTCKIHRGRVTKGSIAGNLHPIYGYRSIKVDGIAHRASRLAWFYVTGKWPDDEIDHENCDNSDNAWDNLREATRVQNQANIRVRTSSKSGLKCVRFHKGRWVAYIGVNKKRRNLGRFDTKEEAHAAYQVAAKQVFGSFARAA